MTSHDLIVAQAILDEHYENVYFKLEVAVSGLTRWPWILLGALILLFAVVASTDLPLLEPLWTPGDKGSRTPPPYGGIAYLFLVAALGMLGAAVTRALTALVGTGRIPEILSSASEWFLRLLVGAASAVGVVLIATAGLLPFKEEIQVYYALAFVAGTSDRLLTRALASINKQAEG